jgi:predicted component of type VI protein secretion system
MWLVLFKRLATTTTHIDLKAFINTDRVNFQAMIQHMTLSVILIVVAGM